MAWKWCSCSLVLPIVTEGWGRHCRWFLHKLWTWEKWQKLVSWFFKNKWKHFLTLERHSCKPYSPFGSCDEANLVRRIPAPSISASSMPPIAAEPTIATGPSKDIELQSAPTWHTTGKQTQQTPNSGNWCICVYFTYPHRAGMVQFYL